MDWLSSVDTDSLKILAWSLLESNNAFRRESSFEELDLCKQGKLRHSICLELSKRSLNSEEVC